MTKHSLLARFVREQKGSVATMLGLTFTMVAGASLGAIEVEQMRRSKSQMQNKLDATILFLGRSDDKATPQAVGTAYLNDAIARDGVEVYNVEPVFTYDPDTGNVSGTVDFNAPTILTGGLVPEVDMRVEATASPKVVGKVEIAMVLDTSGSMEWSFDQDYVDEVYPNRRIDGLHEAASDMFDVIYQNPKAIPAVAVIPYAASVDVTDLYAALPKNTKYERFTGFSGYDLDDLYNPLFGDDIDELTSADVTERSHESGTGVWVAERYQSQNADGSYVLSLDKPKPNYELPILTQTYSPYGYNHYYNYGYRYYHGIGWYSGNMRAANGILPMTYDTQAVRDYVASFEPRGGTAGHIAIAWGLYALTPSWHDALFQHPAGEPQDFNDTTEKYIVFMTDGSFNSQKDPNMNDEEMYKYFKSVCDLADSKGVRIFTVGLKLNATADQHLQDCVGTNGRHYPVDDRAELVEAFKGIGRESGELRLSH